jgi:hypothetical protein
MSDDVELLRRVYELFNRREIERVLAADRLVMHVFHMRNGLIQRFDIRDV